MHEAPKEEHTPFRVTEKHFKNRSTPWKYPTLRGYNVLDLSRPEDETCDEVWRAGWWSPENDQPASKRRRKGKERDLGKRPEMETEGLKRIQMAAGRTGWIVAPGCILIPHYLDPQGQLDLLHSALTRCTRPPNPLSLSTHYALPDDLFGLYAQSSRQAIQPLHRFRPSSPVSSVSSGSSSASKGSRSTIETLPGAVVAYEEIIAKNRLNLVDPPSERARPKTAEDLMREIRWANLGWVYQWTTKAYDFTPDVPIPFPSELECICKEVVREVPWHQVFCDDVGPEDYTSWKDDYVPDTGIVNFYQLNDTLMAHVDRAELDPSRPLVSISLGHATLFLLGSASRHDPPRPIILRSGDVLIMSGRSRQFYHGVPRVLEGTLPETFALREDDDITMSAVKRWISTARVNINARQVFPPGFVRPNKLS